MRLKHYIKVAWRNLLKYKVQSMISVVGLAIGFTFFALSAFWVRYERTFDSFHPDADRILKVGMTSKMLGTSTSSVTPYPLADYLKDTYPEVEEATRLEHLHPNMTLDGMPISCTNGAIDSSFMRIFDVNFLAGNLDFLVPENRQIALSDRKAIELFGSTDVLGKQLDLDGQGHTIGAVFKAWPTHTNIHFDGLTSRELQYADSWGHQSYATYIKVHEGVDSKAFRQKLRDTSFDKDDMQEGITLPTYQLTEMRHTDPALAGVTRVQLNYLYYFLIAGGMIILAAFLNFFTLFISNTRIRMKEFALRVVNGSTGAGLVRMLLVELLLVLLFSFVLGMVFIELILPTFCKFSGIEAARSTVYLQSSVYIASVIVLFLLVCTLIIHAMNRRTLQASLRQEGAAVSRNLFRKASVVFQLATGILFIFCTVVMMRQVLLLKNSDIGLDYKDRGVLLIYAEDKDEIISRIGQIPGIEQMLDNYNSIFPLMITTSYYVGVWDGKTEDQEPCRIRTMSTDEKHIDFYHFRLKQGRYLTDNDSERHDVMINEAAARAFGWYDAVGKKFDGNTVVGVIQDFYCYSTTELPEPVYFKKGNGQNTLLKVYEDQWNTVAQQIKQLMQKEYPQVMYNLYGFEEHYEKLFRSEDALMKVLAFTAAICILICLFGIYSLVTLTCEERRREIGIRKVNGATLADILRNMLREYLLLLVVASAIAFPLGYVIIKPWVMQYIRQTAITPWLFLLIFIGLALVILASISNRVLKAARTNPAEVIRNE